VHFLRHEDGKSWFEITIYEGKNQQIRRMGEATGFPVMRLARVSFAGITHEDLRPGQWRFLTVDELMELRKEYGVPKRVRSSETAGRSLRPFGKVQARGEARHTRGETRPPRGDGPPRGEGRPPRGEGRPPRGDGPPRSEGRPPRGDGPPRDEGRPPRQAGGRATPDRRPAPRSRAR
jgi:23S rRNA pseudouridine2605 synthase